MPEDKTTPVAEEQADQAVETKTEAPEDQVQQDEEKRFTQAEVDAIVQKRLQRERSKEKDQHADQAEDAETKQTLANLQEDMRAMQVENYALKKGVSENHIGYVVKLAGTVEADTAVDQVLKDFPHFTEKPPADTGMDAVRASVSKSKPEKAKMTRAEIAAIKDPAARRKAIAENIALYTD
ncbi:hypothetical protein ACLGL1_09445 [Peptococcus simiae]|uniref:hypothetical protein n=1 Tax=Peptococcus simiae TaxID=1643805 RepID=UPI00398031D7